WLRRLPFRAHGTDAADPGIPAALPDGPLWFAGFRDRHRPERHGRGDRDALRGLQPPGGALGRDRLRRHPSALSRRTRPCRVERWPARLALVLDGKLACMIIYGMPAERRTHVTWRCLVARPRDLSRRGRSKRRCRLLES